MNCEKCEKDANLLVILPLHRPDGCLNTIACLECAKKSGVYCLKHKKPHLGFDDGTTVCIYCIEAEVEQHRVELTDLVNTEIFSQIDEGAIERYNAWLAELSVKGGEINKPAGIRAIVTLALRRRVEPKAVIEAIKNEGLDIILPPQYRLDPS